jgi:glycerophosphoryl diester phosphodiesterase
VATSIYGAGAGPLAIAHRGGAGLAAENTLDAFARSYALGVRYLETDVRVSADGACVAFHDAALRRVLGRGGTVRGATRRELARLGVPTLDEVLRAFPDACFTVDVKEAGVIAPLGRTLRATSAAYRVCGAGAWDGWLAALRDDLGPELTTALGWRALAALLAGTPQAAPTPALVPPAGVDAGQGRFAHVPSRVVRVFGARLVARAHALGMRIIVWTVNDPGQMHRMLDLGMDGVITDRPDLLREVLVARDQWVAPSPAPPAPVSAPAPPAAASAPEPTTSERAS